MTPKLAPLVKRDVFEIYNVDKVVDKKGDKKYKLGNLNFDHNQRGN